MSTQNSVDVLIIGAGPAGLMCGYILSQAGLNIRIVDRRSERLLKGQGDATHPRGMEIMESLGLGQKLRSEGARVYIYTTYKETEDGNLIRISQRNAQIGVNTPFNYLLLNAQTTLEGIFREAMGSGDKIIDSYTVAPEIKPLAPKKLIVEQNTHPTNLTISDDPAEFADPLAYAATVTLESPNGGVEKVNARYVLGCDGAHSWTRRQLGIDMVGESSDDVWGVIDCYVDTNFPDYRTLAFLMNKGVQCAILPRENNMTRFTMQFRRSEVSIDSETGRVDRLKITVETIQNLVKKAMDPYYVNFIGEPYWWGVYVVGQRLASGYNDSRNRVFLVGDACHTHSPHAGQGMNAALSDGHNLSWKLAHVLKGWAGKELLSTYEFERREFAKDLIDLHKQMAAMTMGEMHGNPADLQMKTTPFIAGVGVKYGESRIVSSLHQQLAPGISVGVRFPHHIIIRAADYWPISTHDLLKSDLKYKLLVFTGNPTTEAQVTLLEKLAGDLSRWLEKSPVLKAMVQVYTIMHLKKEEGSFTMIPTGLRSAWDTVFIDDIAFTKSDGGGNAYETFGIGEKGCIALVRPDACVGGIAPLDGVKEIEELLEHVLSVA